MYRLERRNGFQRKTTLVTSASCQIIHSKTISMLLPSILRCPRLDTLDRQVLGVVQGQPGALFPRAHAVHTYIPVHSPNGEPLPRDWLRPRLPSIKYADQ